MQAPRSRTFAALLIVVVAAVTPSLVSHSGARADVTTVSVDSSRSGWDQHEGDENGPGLDPNADVKANDFGQLWKASVEGEVYASPLVITKGGTKVVVVGTETNDIYGFDPITGGLLWHRDLGPSWKVANIGCSDLTPDIGITSTGVYDPASGYVYVTTKKDDGPDELSPSYWVDAFDPLTGAERAGGWPLKVQGHPDNNPAVTFKATYQLQRTGLTLVNGVVYIGFGSHCDYGDFYSGYIVGVSTNAPTITAMWASSSTSATAGGAGIWEAGGGMVAVGNTDLWASTGNTGDNTYSPKPGLSETAVPDGLSEAVVHVHIGVDGKLTPTQFFAPFNADQLDTGDVDLGSGGLIDLPAQYFGTAAHPHLLVQLGKDHRMYILDRDHLGGRIATNAPNPYTNIVQEIDTTGGQWGHPAAYGGDNGQHGYFYVTQMSNSNPGDNGASGPLTAYRYGLTGGGAIAFTKAAEAPGFGYTSGSPVVTSDGTAPGSALVWAVQSDHPPAGSSGQCDTCYNNGHLLAYPAVPPSGSWTPIWTSPDLGPVTKFTVPATDAGHVYLGTWGTPSPVNDEHHGQVFAFGRPTTVALSSPSVDLGTQAIGGTSTGTVTLTAHANVSITATSAVAPFGATNVTGNLAPGQTIAVPVSFSPTATGPAVGAVSVSYTTGSTSASTQVGLSGVGTQVGLKAEPTGLAFGDPDDPVATGTTQQLAVSIKNTGQSDESITSVTPPSGTGPFTATLPDVGTVIAPQDTVTVPVAFAPTAAGSFTGSFTVTADGASAVVTLSGSAVVAAPHLDITPTAVDYGDVAVGSSAHQTLTLANTGNVTVYLSTAKGPSSPFSVTKPVSEGQGFQPGATVPLDIVFSPTAPGPASSTYVFDAADGQGRRTITFTGNGVAAPSPTPSPTPSASPSASPSPSPSASPTGTATPSPTRFTVTTTVRALGLTFRASVAPSTVRIRHGSHGIVTAITATVPVRDAQGRAATLVLLLRRARSGWTGTATLLGSATQARRAFATNGQLNLHDGRFAGSAHSRGAVLQWRIDGGAQQLRARS